jgi:sugar lactone lactonase YvrE
MRRSSSFLCIALVSLLAVLPSPAQAWDRGRATPFAHLPDGAFAPEGLEVDGDGNVYVGTLGSSSGDGELFVFDRHGRFVRQLALPDASPNLLGLGFHPTSGALLVVDFGTARVFAVDPSTGASAPFMTLPAESAPGAGLNDVTFDEAGNVYVSDSFRGAVWRTGPAGGEATVWVEDALLRTDGVPPFGANGLRFDTGETALFVSNTGEDTVVRIPVVGGSPGTTGAAGAPAVFANGVNGADGLLVDEDDNVWVVANQADEIVVIDPTGRAIAKLGDFDGIGRDGAAKGLLFPASIRFSGKELLVTTLALDLRSFDPTFTTVDSAWTAEVTRHAVAKIRARLRPLDGAP